MYIVFDIKENKYVKQNAYPHGWTWVYTDNPLKAKMFKSIRGIKNSFGHFILRDKDGNFLIDKKGNYITYFPEDRFKIIEVKIKIMEK